MLPRYVDEYINKLIKFIENYDIDALVIDDLDIDDYNYRYFIDKFADNIINFERNEKGQYKFILDQFQTMNTIKFMIDNYGIKFGDIDDNLLQNYFLLYLYDEHYCVKNSIEYAIENKIKIYKNKI